MTKSDGTYHPDLIRRTYIAKGDGTERPLGIPTVTDRIVQMAVKLVTEPLFEADFLPCSFGYRPKKSSPAVAQIDHHLFRGYRWAVDVHLKSDFDTIPHKRLLDRRLRGWVQYFRISNFQSALKGLVRYACEQLRLYLRRRFSRKRSQYSRCWPDAMLYDHYGLLICRVSDLARS